MLATTTPRCHRCLEPMTLFVVGDDYCRQCARELAAKARQPKAPTFLPLWRQRSLIAKDYTRYPGGAA